MMKKDYLHWRSKTTNETLKQLKKNYKEFGITRIANVTGLDHVGIPIYSAIRPNSKTIVSSAGKGLTDKESLISAVMESIETEVAENLHQKFIFSCSWQDLPENNRVPINLLPIKSNFLLKKETIISWTLCKSFCDSKEIFLPTSLVTMSQESCKEQFTVTSMGSNGLASGMNFEDAFLSGLYELIERDAIKCWGYGMRYRKLMNAFIREETIPYKTTKRLIKKIKEAGLTIYISDFSTDIDIPVFKCIVCGDVDDSISSCEGFGCHHNPEIAINRSITEAVQARTIIIAGSRDDFTENVFLKAGDFHRIFLNNSKKIIREEFNQFKQYNQTYQLFNNSKDAIKDIMTKFKELSIKNLYYFQFLNANPFTVLRLNCLDLVPYIPGSEETSFLPHPRYGLFTPKIFGIRKAIFKLNN